MFTDGHLPNGKSYYLLNQIVPRDTKTSLTVKFEQQEIFAGDWQMSMHFHFFDIKV